MSYCPIDEAFGHFMTDGFTPDPLESSAYKTMKNNNCTKKNKLRRKKINCNRNNTTFSENPDDIYHIEPDLTDDDRDFDEKLESYSPLNHMDLYSLNSITPTKNKNSKLSRKKRNTRNQPSATSRASNMGINNTIEGFDNYNSNANNVVSNSNRNNSVIRKQNRSNKRNVEKNEIFEHAPEDDLPIEELREIHNIVNEEEDDSESDAEETRPSLRNNSNSNTNRNTNTNPKGGMNSQISEINNKINFIMNQISNKDNEITESEHNNIHDIILFVIFGIFVLIILEALYRLISKMVRANTILANSVNSPPKVGVGDVTGNNIVGGNGNSVLSSSDTFDVVRQYAKSRM